MANEQIAIDLHNTYIGTIDGRNDAVYRGYNFVVEPKDLKIYRVLREVCKQTLGDADVKLGGWIVPRKDSIKLRWADNQEQHKMFFKSLDDITQAAFTMKLLAA